MPIITKEIAGSSDIISKADQNTKVDGDTGTIGNHCYYFNTGGFGIIGANVDSEGDCNAGADSYTAGLDIIDPDA